MDWKRVSLAAVVAWLVATIYGMAVHQMVLGEEFAKYPAVFRAQGDMAATLPFMLAGRLLAMLALAYMYAKGYEGGHGVREGIRFGVLLALFFFGFVWVGIWGSFNIHRRTAVLGSVVSFIQMIVVGAVIGALYKPTARPKAADAAA